MLSLMLSDVIDSVDGELLGDDAELTGFSIDTRTINQGDLYIAIQGDRFDGHEFCHKAEQNGASALMVHRRVDSDLPQLLVEDTRISLGLLGRMWAQQFQVPTVAITGSNGKTTVKEMTAAILGQLGPVLATEGNFNNDIGVPLTLLRLREHHQYAVIEIGANHAGEVGALSKLVQPDVAIVNNVGPAHLEGFGSIEAVADAKSEIYSGLRSDGWAVINADDQFADVMRDAASHCHVHEFGASDDVSVRLLPDNALKIALGDKTLAPRFSLLGKHNRLNAVAATAAAQCLDVQPVAIMSGLAAVRAVAGRLNLQAGLNSSRLIDDTYNANPASVKAAINVLAEFEGRRILVLGDLGELGADEASLHAELGEYAQQAGIDSLFTVGVLSANAASAFNGARHFDAKDNLITELREQLNNDTTVLIKGSRGSRMEEVLKPLIDRAPQTDNAMTIDAEETSEVISL